MQIHIKRKDGRAKRNEVRRKWSKIAQVKSHCNAMVLLYWYSLKWKISPAGKNAPFPNRRDSSFSFYLPSQFSFSRSFASYYTTMMQPADDSKYRNKREKKYYTFVFLAFHFSLRFFFSYVFFFFFFLFSFVFFFFF